MSGKASNALYRQWLLLQCIPQSGEGISNGELQQALCDEGLTVSLRTVQRDMESICQLFPVYSTSEFKPLRWRWVEGRRVQVPGISITEALSLVLVGSTARHLLPGSVLSSLEPSLQQARQVLDSMKSHSALASWIDKVDSVIPGIYQKPPIIDNTLLARVQNALLKDSTIVIQYRPIQTEGGKAYDVLPLAIVQRGVTLYLVARVAGESQIKLFAMHRIDTVGASDLVIEKPAGFSLKTYLSRGALQFSDGVVLTLKARVSAALAAHLVEAPLAEDMALTSLGREQFLLHASVHDGWQLDWWLLSQGEQIEVLEPQGLRQRIKHKLESAAAPYLSELRCE